MHLSTASVDPLPSADRRFPLAQRRVVIVALVALAFVITLGPFPVDLFDATHHAIRTIVSLGPGGVADRPTRSESEALLNLVVPSVLVLAVAAGWPDARAPRLLLGAVATTIGIEAIQALIPGRFAEAQDVVLNSAGAATGVAVVVAVRAHRRSGRR